jgi:flagellar motility protein MotE (MotC chaperone)
MASDLLYVSRVMRLPLIDADGNTIGRISDVVLLPPHLGSPPRVGGFVAGVQRRRVFVSAGKVDELDRAGVRLRSANLDARPFELRPGELLASDLLDSAVGDATLADIALRRTAGRTPGWDVSTLALGARTGLRRRRAPRVVPWDSHPELFRTAGVPTELAAYREMHPSEVANAVRRLPIDRRRQLAEAMDDERLADVLEELDEEEQLRIIEGLDVERLAHVLEEMEPDDAVDLLSEMTDTQQRQLLNAMDPGEALPLRRLLRYGEHTAGGLMTPEPVILAPTSSVAEALSRLRDPELQPALAAQVFVTDPPTVAPTGRYLGAVGIQRLLREPPSVEVGRLVDDDEPPVVPPTMPEAEVAARLAAYNLLALAVCDDAGHLLGAVSIDDVLDAVLPEGWRAAIR